METDFNILSFSIRSISVSTDAFIVNGTVLAFMYFSCEFISMFTLTLMHLIVADSLEDISR